MLNPNLRGPDFKIFPVTRDLGHWKVTPKVATVFSVSTYLKSYRKPCDGFYIENNTLAIWPVTGKVFKTLNDRQSYIHSKFHQIGKSKLIKIIICPLRKVSLVSLCWVQKTNHVLWHYELYFFFSSTAGQSFQNTKWLTVLYFHYILLDFTHMIVWFCWIISICEIYGEYRTEGH